MVAENNGSTMNSADTLKCCDFDVPEAEAELHQAGYQVKDGGRGGR